MTSFTEAAVAAFKKAAAYDEAGGNAATDEAKQQNFRLAYNNYLEAVEIFMTAIKYEKADVAKQTLKKKANEIVDRASQIKDYLDQAKQAAANPPGNAGNAASASTKMAKKGDDAGGGKKDEKEEEKSRMRGSLEGSIVREKPNVKWEDIGGLEGAKDALKETVILPMKFPQLFSGDGNCIQPTRGILLYGPPGTGKSMLAKSLCTMADANFFSVSSSDLMSRWLGESEKLIRNLFEMAREAHKEEGRPSIIFIDEIDSLCGSRSEGENDAVRRIKTEFLVQMQGVGHDDTGILVLGATNIPWGLDAAIRRRFERRIYIPLPDTNTRLQMIKIFLSKANHTLTEEQLRSIAERTEWYSGSDMNVLVRLAMMEPIRTMTTATHFRRVFGPDPDDPTKETDMRLVPCSPSDPYGAPMTLHDIPHEYSKYVMALPVDYPCFVRALTQARSSVNAADLAQQEKFTAEFGQEGN